MRTRARGRLAFAVAGPLVAVALIAATSAVPVHHRRSSPVHVAAWPAGPSPAAVAHAAYVRARAHGSPIAILTHATVLRAAPRGHVLARLGLRTEFRSPQVLAAVAERNGWLRVIASELPNGRRGWIPASAATLASDPWKIEASLSQRSVTVLRSGREVRRFTVAVGSLVTPTPTGRFAVTDKINMIGASAYGCCALAISGHQPHVAQGWTGGDRLAIHSTTMPATIGRAVSNGCLRASTADARWLIDNVDLGTIVQIGP